VSSRTSEDAVGRRLLLIAVLVVASCAAVWAGGCAEQVETQAAAIDLDPAAAEIAYPPSPRSDWYHILAVLEELRERPPSRPLVVLLAGSSGRESTVSDESWSAEVSELGGPAVAAYNLSSRNKTFTHDLDLVRLLPRTPTLVFIGVNLGRFTVSPDVQARGPATLPDDLEFSHNQHHYARRVILPPEEKQLAIDEWLSKRSAQFGECCAANRAVLDEVVRVCLARGYEPVLLELPRDKEAIGDRLDDPIARYQRGCKAVAEEYGIPYIDFIEEADLTTTDFYDLAHLIEPGYVEWQRLLAQTTVELLDDGD
jgi:lysophospholipase L1-like esterase